jgi:transposase, IS5 family
LLHWRGSVEVAMPRKKVGQLGMMDAALAQRGRRGGDDDLDVLSRLVDWERFALLLKGVHSARKGEASYPPLTMFKILLLQRWHGLSDPGLEAALADRLSFMRFAGLSLDDPTPNHSTIWRFRDALGKSGLFDVLMVELNAQLASQGASIRPGTLVDASLVIRANPL